MGLAITLLVMVAVWVAVIYMARNSSAARQERLVRELHRTDRKVEGDYRQARRAMNDAANQSWRNMADGDPRG